jgi:hypothetical protein
MVKRPAQKMHQDLGSADGSVKNEPQETADHGHAKATDKATQDGTGPTKKRTRATSVLEAKEKVAKKARLRVLEAKEKVAKKARLRVLEAKEEVAKKARLRVLEAKEKVAKKARLLDDKRAAHAKNKAVTKAFQMLKAEDDLKNAQKELATAEAKHRTAKHKTWEMRLCARQPFGVSYAYK